MKPCVSFGQDNDLVYCTVPATSTQGAISAEDKAKQARGGVQLVRFLLSYPNSTPPIWLTLLDTNLHLVGATFLPSEDCGEQSEEDCEECSDIGLSPCKWRDRRAWAGEPGLKIAKYILLPKNIGILAYHHATQEIEKGYACWRKQTRSLLQQIYMFLLQNAFSIHLIQKNCYLSIRNIFSYRHMSVSSCSMGQLKRGGDTLMVFLCSKLQNINKFKRKEFLFPIISVPDE